MRVDMRTLIAILNLHLVLGSTDYIEGPRNMVVSAGQPMEMECRADRNSTVNEWSMQRPFTSNKITIFVNSKGQKKIKIEHFGIVEGTNGSVILYKSSTEMNDAGIYTCAVQKGLKQPDRQSAHLIVFETEPVCETNLSTSEINTFEEGTLLWMRCTVNFTGSWAPTLEWRLHEGNGETEEPKDLTDWANVEVVPNANISSTLTIALNATNNSSYYSCTIYFPSVNNSELVTAGNSPDYIYRWKSPMVTSFPKPVIPTMQGTRMATDDSGKNANDSKSIYLVAGVAVLFGIASSLAALIHCLRLRRKNSAAMENIDQTEGPASEYDLIPYARTDDYDTIEEVNEMDDTLVTSLPPRLGPLPSLHYSGLAPVESRPPGVYSRLDHKEKSAENKESDIGWNEQHTHPERSTSDQSKLPDGEDSTRLHSYLVLETNACNDIATDGETCLKVREEFLQSIENNNVIGTTQKEDSNSNQTLTLGSNSYLHLKTNRDKEIAEESEEIPSDYLKVMEDSLPSNSDSNVYETTQKGNSSRKSIPESNNYAELLTKSDGEIAEESEEIPSEYLKMSEDFNSIQTTLSKKHFKQKTEAENEYLIPT